MDKYVNQLTEVTSAGNDDVIPIQPVGVTGLRKIKKSNLVTSTSGSGASIGLGRRNFEAGTTSPPSNQGIRYNNATPASVTEIYIDDEDLDDQDRSNAILETTAGSLLRIITDESNFNVFKVTSVTDDTGSFTIVVTHLESKGAISGEVSVEVDLKSDGENTEQAFTTTILVDKEYSSVGSQALTQSGATVLTYDKTGAKKGKENLKQIDSDGSNVTINGLVTGDTLIVNATGVTAANNVLSGFTNGNSYFFFFKYQSTGSIVIVADATAFTEAVPPSATSLSITGTQEVGQTLTLNYTYNANDGGAESGSIFKWTRSDDSGGTNEVEISGANSSTYVLQSADNGKFIRASVTPSDGTLTGVETFSARVGAIDLPTLSTPTLTATPGDQQITLVWTDEDVNATGRVLLRSTTNDEGTATAVAGYDGTDNYVDDNDGASLTNGTPYYYWGHNTASGYNDSASASDSATPSAAAPPELLSAFVSGDDPDSWHFEFSEEMVLTDETGWTLEYDDGGGYQAATITGVTGSGTTTMMFGTTESVDPAWTLRASYSQTGDTRSDATDVELEAIVNEPVTNNVSYSFANTHSMVIDAQGEGSTVTQTNLLPTDGTNDLPIAHEFWYKTPAALNTQKIIFQIGDGEDASKILCFVNTLGFVNYRRRKSANNHLLWVTTDNALTTNTWHKIMIRDTGGTSLSSVTININSVQASISLSQAGTYAKLGPVSGSVVMNTPLSSAATFGEGKINLQRIWNALPTNAQVTTLWNGGVPRGAILLANLLIEKRFNNNHNSAVGTNGSAVGSPTFDTDIPS